MTPQQERQLEAARERMKEMTGLGHHAGSVIFALRQEGYAAAVINALEEEKA